MIKNVTRFPLFNNNSYPSMPKPYLPVSATQRDEGGGEVKASSFSLASGTGLTMNFRPKYTICFDGLQGMSRNKYKNT